MFSTRLNNISEIGSFPQVGVKIKKYSRPPPKWRTTKLPFYLKILPIYTANIPQTLAQELRNSLFFGFRDALGWYVGIFLDDLHPSFLDVIADFGLSASKNIPPTNKSQTRGLWPFRWLQQTNKEYRKYSKLSNQPSSLSWLAESLQWFDRNARNTAYQLFLLHTLRHFLDSHVGKSLCLCKQKQLYIESQVPPASTFLSCCLILVSISVHFQCFQVKFQKDNVLSTPC